ncbi:MAG TPA: hypothetical protein VFY29_05860 [Terriglobia bacterium]|nr:hypothetical protein [Terriglobia bacterium]
MRAFRRILLPILWAMVAFLPAARALGPVPAQLSDLEFWKLITDSSEDGGGFISENFVSNELGYPYVMPTLIQRARRDGAYIGVGPEQNFSYVAAIHPRIAFIVDIRRQNLVQHLLYKALFELSATREDFLALLFARKPTAHAPAGATVDQLLALFEGAPPDEALHRANLDRVIDTLLKQHHFELTVDDRETLRHVYDEFARQGVETRYSVLPAILNTFAAQIVTVPVNPAPDDPGTPAPEALARGGSRVLLLPMEFPSFSTVMKAADPAGKRWSFLATDENYRTVRNMQQKNLIVPLVGDFAGVKALRAVAQYLREHDTRVTAFYVSNVEQYLTPVSKLQSFYLNVADLPIDESGTFIRTAQTSGKQPGPAQSFLSSMQTALEAVRNGQARVWNDILPLSLPLGQ